MLRNNGLHDLCLRFITLICMLLRALTLRFSGLDCGSVLLLVAW